MTPLDTIKQRIWGLSNRNIITVQLAADKALVQLPITRVEDAEKVLKELQRKPRKVKAKVSLIVIERYRAAKLKYDTENFPNCIKDHGFIEPDMPEVGSANGLTKFVINHATWMGCHANRINTSGRKIGDKWITGTTKKGTSDTALIISGRSIHLEIKVGRDKPRADQLKQQAAVRKAGGIYEFIHTPEEYLQIFDRYYVPLLFTT